jgi:hypothetical protein
MVAAFENIFILREPETDHQFHLPQAEGIVFMHFPLPRLFNDLFNDLFNPPSMALIHEFIVCVSSLKASNPNRAVVIVSPNQYGHFGSARLASLVGAFKLLVQNIPIKDVESWLLTMFEADTDVPFRTQNDIKFLLRALEHAMKNGYIEYEKYGSNALICDNIDEYLHYTSPVHGSVHIVVPGKLIVFPNSSGHVSDGTGSSAAMERARFYADLLRHFDVSLVANLTTPTDSPTAMEAAVTFESAGLAFEDLLPPPSSIGAGLRMQDIIISHGRTMGGAIALQCGGAVGATEAGALVTAVLMEQEGFGEAEAKAWLQLMCPRLVRHGE